VKDPQLQAAALSAAFLSKEPEKWADFLELYITIT